MHGIALDRITKVWYKYIINHLSLIYNYMEIIFTGFSKQMERKLKDKVAKELSRPLKEIKRKSALSKKKK